MILPKAFDDISRLDKPIAQQIAAKLEWLSKNTNSITPLPLQGRWAGLSKLRSGDYRVIYEINHETQTITVHKIGHRRDIYQ
ncbi:MAG: type II toxin-antitoxin system RelE/ParE family toxin [Nitrospirae bacterium]|nr:MAG: type II toxin-antitoxin system RelE/ParE family toxin [Nitrospirota bacterium]